MNHVPVVDMNRVPLMPTSGKRARKLMERKEATPFWSGGVFCIRLNKEPSARNMQEIVVAVDPGSKREGYSVKSKTHDYLNITANAKDWVGEKLERRRALRRNRRQRKTPCRSPHRKNNRPDRIPTGTRVRWEWKLRIINWLSKIYPLSKVIVEDIKAWTKKGKRKWNISFSPLQTGKNWFYNKIKEMGVELKLIRGYETKKLRDQLGLRKTKRKLLETFDAHCIDSWVMAWNEVGGIPLPQHRRMMRIVPIQRQRRCLHREVPSKGSIRGSYGGTNKGGLKTGTLVKHPKYGLCYTGGFSKRDGLTLHSIETGKRVIRTAKKEDLDIKCSVSWRFHYL